MWHAFNHPQDARINKTSKSIRDVSSRAVITHVQSQCAFMAMLDRGFVHMVLLLKFIQIARAVIKSYCIQIEDGQCKVIVAIVKTLGDPAKYPVVKKLLAEVVVATTRFQERLSELRWCDDPDPTDMRFPVRVFNQIRGMLFPSVNSDVHCIRVVESVHKIYLPFFFQKCIVSVPAQSPSLNGLFHSTVILRAPSP